MTDIAADPQHSLPNVPKRVPAIDRLTPSVRPSERPVMRQKWRDLLFVHWPIESEALRPLVPAQLELDLYDGRAYVGLVPFTMTGVRPVGLPSVPGVSSFHETNVRTYVRLGDCDPGVWFFNLEAASAIAVRLARWLFYLPYHYVHVPGTRSQFAARRAGLDSLRGDAAVARTGARLVCDSCPG